VRPDKTNTAETLAFMASAEGEVQLRFRHQKGDLGPITFSLSLSIASIKDKLVLEWPKGKWTDSSD
jgi:hypothetical protein